MIFPLTYVYLAMAGYFFSMTVAMSVLPLAFKDGAIWYYFSEVAMWFAVLELAFFDPTVVPTSSTCSVFFFRDRVDLTKVVIGSKLALKIALLSYHGVIFNI